MPLHVLVGLHRAINYKLILVTLVFISLCANLLSTLTLLTFKGATEAKIINVSIFVFFSYDIKVVMLIYQVILKDLSLLPAEEETCSKCFQCVFELNLVKLRKSYFQNLL